MKTQFEQPFQQNHSQFLCMSNQSAQYALIQVPVNRYKQSSTADPTKKNRQKKQFVGNDMVYCTQSFDKKTTSENNVQLMQIDRNFQNIANKDFSEQIKCQNCNSQCKLSEVYWCQCDQKINQRQEKHSLNKNGLAFLQENHKNIQQNTQIQSSKMQTVQNSFSKPGIANKQIRQYKIKLNNKKDKDCKYKQGSSSRKQFNSSRGAYFIRNFPQTYFENVDILFELINRRKYKAVQNSKKKTFISTNQPSGRKLLKNVKGDTIGPEDSQFLDQVILLQQQQKAGGFATQQAFNDYQCSQDSQETVKNPRTFAQFPIRSTNKIQTNKNDCRTAYNPLKHIKDNVSAKYHRKLEIQLPLISNNTQEQKLKQSVFSGKGIRENKDTKSQISLPERVSKSTKNIKQQKLKEPSANKQSILVQSQAVKKIHQSKTISAQPKARSPNRNYLKQKSQISFNPSQNKLTQGIKRIVKQDKPNGLNNVNLNKQTDNQNQCNQKRLSDQGRVIRKQIARNSGINLVNKKQNSHQNTENKITFRSRKQQNQKNNNVSKQRYEKQIVSRINAKQQKIKRIQVDKSQQLGKDEQSCGKRSTDKGYDQMERKQKKEDKVKKGDGQEQIVQKRKNHQSCKLNDQFTKYSKDVAEFRFTFQQKNQLNKRDNSFNQDKFEQCLEQNENDAREQTIIDELRLKESQLMNNNEIIIKQEHNPLVSIGLSKTNIRQSSQKQMQQFSKQRPKENSVSQSSSIACLKPQEETKKSNLLQTQQKIDTNIRPVCQNQNLVIRSQEGSSELKLRTQITQYLNEEPQTQNSKFRRQNQDNQNQELQIQKQEIKIQTQEYKSQKQQLKSQRQDLKSQNEYTEKGKQLLKQQKQKVKQQKQEQIKQKQEDKQQNEELKRHQETYALELISQYQNKQDGLQEDTNIKENSRKRQNLVDQQNGNQQQDNFFQPIDTQYQAFRQQETGQLQVQNKQATDKPENLQNKNSYKCQIFGHQNNQKDQCFRQIQVDQISDNQKSQENESFDNNPNIQENHKVCLNNRQSQHDEKQTCVKNNLISSAKMIKPEQKGQYEVKQAQSQKENCQKQEKSNMMLQNKQQMQFRKGSNYNCPQLRIDKQVSLLICPKLRINRQVSVFINPGEFREQEKSVKRNKNGMDRNQLSNQFSLTVEPNSLTLETNSFGIKSLDEPEFADLRSLNTPKYMQKKQKPEQKTSKFSQRKMLQQSIKQKRSLRISLDSNISSFNNLETNNLLYNSIFKQKNKNRIQKQLQKEAIEAEIIQMHSQISDSIQNHPQTDILQKQTQILKVNNDSDDANKDSDDANKDSDDIVDNILEVSGQIKNQENQCGSGQNTNYNCQQQNYHPQNWQPQQFFQRKKRANAHTIVYNQFANQNKLPNQLKKRNERRNSICQFMMSPFALNNQSINLWPNKKYHPTSFNTKANFATNMSICTHQNLGKDTTNELPSPDLTSNYLNSTNKDAHNTLIQCSGSQQKIMAQFYDELIQLGVDQIRDIPDNYLLLAANAQRMGYNISSQEQNYNTLFKQNNLRQRDSQGSQSNTQLISKGYNQGNMQIGIPAANVRGNRKSFTINPDNVGRQSPLNFTNFGANKPHPQVKNIFKQFEPEKIDQAEMGQEESLKKDPKDPHKALQSAEKVNISHIDESQVIDREQKHQQSIFAKQKMSMEQISSKRISIDQALGMAKSKKVSFSNELSMNAAMENSVIHVFGINGSRTPEEFVKNSRLMKDQFLNIINEDDESQNAFNNGDLIHKVVSAVLIEDQVNSKNQDKSQLIESQTQLKAVVKSISKQSIGIQCVEMIEKYDEDEGNIQQESYKGQNLIKINQNHAKERIIGFCSNIINYSEVIHKPIDFDYGVSCEKADCVQNQNRILAERQQYREKRMNDGCNQLKVDSNIKNGEVKKDNLSQKGEEQLSDSALTFGNSSQNQEGQSQSNGFRKDHMSDIKKQNKNSYRQFQNEEYSVGLSKDMHRALKCNEQETPNYQFYKKPLQSKEITMKLSNHSKFSEIENDNSTNREQTQSWRHSRQNIQNKLRLNLKQLNNQPEEQLPLYSKNDELLEYREAQGQSKTQNAMKNIEIMRKQTQSQISNQHCYKPYKYPPKNKNPHPQYTDREYCHKRLDSQGSDLDKERNASIQTSKNRGNTQRINISHSPLQKRKNSPYQNDVSDNVSEPLSSEINFSPRNQNKQIHSISHTSNFQRGIQQAQDKNTSKVQFSKDQSQSVLNEKLSYRFQNAQIINHIEKQKMRLQVMTLGSQFTPQRWKKLVRSFDSNYQTACDILNLFKGDFQGRIFPFKDYRQGVCWLFGLHSYSRSSKNQKFQHVSNKQKARFEPFVLAKEHDFHKCKSYKQAIYQLYLSTLAQQGSFVKKKERGSLVLENPKTVDQYLQMLTGSPIIRLLNQHQKRNWKKLRYLQKHRNIRALAVQNKDGKKRILRILANQQITVHERIKNQNANPTSDHSKKLEIKASNIQRPKDQKKQQTIEQTVKLVKLQDQNGKQFNVEWKQFCGKYEEVLLGCFNSHYHIRTLCVPFPQSQENNAFIFTLIIHNQTENCPTDRANSQKSRAKSKSKSERSKVQKQYSTHCVFSLLAEEECKKQEGRILIYSAIDSNKYQYLGKGDASFASTMLKPGEYLLVLQCRDSVINSKSCSMLIYSSNQNIEVSKNGKWFSCSEEGMKNEIEQFRNYLK